MASLSRRLTTRQMTADSNTIPQRRSGGSNVTTWIEAKANELLEHGLLGLKRTTFEKALCAPTTHRHDYLNAYITDLANVLDMDAIRGAQISLGVDPLGGAGVHFWGRLRSITG